MTSGPAQRSVLSAAAFLMLLIAAFATRNPLLLLAYTIAAFYVVLSRINEFRTLKPRERAAVALLVLGLTIMLPIAVARNERAMIHYFIVLVSLAAAFLQTRNIEVYLGASRLALGAALSAVFIYLLFRGLDDFPLEDMLADSSSNGITSYLIVLQANYCIVRYIITRRPSIITPLLTLLICIVGYGRGSLLASAAIILVNLLLYFSPRRPLHALATLLLTAAAALVLYQRYAEDVVFFVEANTKIGSGLYDQPRDQQINEYLGRIDAVTLISGADYRGTSIEVDYNNNPHNSYIRAHHVFGLPYLLLMLLFPWLLGSRRLSPGQRVYTLAMLLIVLFRAFTEPILFPTMFDFFFFAACFALRRPGAARRR